MSQEDEIVIDSNFTQPQIIDETVLINDTIIASIQRFQASLLNSKIDLFITDFWVVDEYGRDDAVYTLDQFMELDEINAYKDKIYYVTADDGTQIPMGIITNNRTYNENPVGPLRTN